MDKNRAVSLHGGGSGLAIQLGAGADDASIRLVVAASRAQDLGDVATLGALDSAIVVGANTFTADTVTGLTYDASVDTLFDLRDGINDANAGITATVTGGRLRLDSGNVAKVLSADTGGAMQALFGASSPTTTRQQATATTAASAVGVTAVGTLSITASVPATSGGAADTALLGEVGINSSGTVRATATVGATAPATDQNTVGEVGSTAGQLRIEIFDATGIDPAPVILVSYTADESLGAVAARVAGLLNDYEWPVSGTGDGGAPATVDFGTATAGAMVINLAPSGSTNTDIFTVSDVTGSLANKLGLDAGTMATAQSSTGIPTVAQSEYVDVAYAPTDTLEAFRARLEVALQLVDVVGASTVGNMLGATVAVSGGTFTIATGDTDVSLAITGAAPALGLSGTGDTITGSMLDRQVQAEMVTVGYDPSDTLGEIAARVQSALREAGAIGFSTTSSWGGTLAEFDVSIGGGFSVDVADPGGVAVITSITDTGGLAAALGLPGNPNASAATSPAAVLETAYTLASFAFGSGVTSLVSGSGATVDVGTQAGASASLAIMDLAIGQVGAARADLGAVQSRLEAAIRSITVASENASAANSRISDADIASEMADLVRHQILEQAGASVLAQANQAPSFVLQLLR